jgi:hypothetical protein
VVTAGRQFRGAVCARGGHAGRRPLPHHPAPAAGS